jgi:Chaperone of endosialidase
MGIRRRRRKLTTLMSRLDQRVKAVELRPISLLTQSQVAAAIETGTTTQEPTAVLDIDAPMFRKVQDAYIYPKRITGSEDRVEIYLESDLKLEKGETLHVSGIHAASGGTALDASSESFKVASLDTPPWTNRTLPDGTAKHDPSVGQLPGVTISNTYSFKPETTAPTSWTKRYQLQTKRKVSTYAISGDTVTLVMNATHKFLVDDIVFIDIFQEDSRAYGTDGLFKITAVTSNTITYKLDAGVDEPIPATTPAEDVYVFPVAKKFLAVGSTWADSANNKIYYWDGIRWVDYSNVSDPVRDGDPPAAPTGLTVTDTPLVSNTLYVPYAKVKLSWTAPTTTKAGKELTDLAGYIIRWRKSTLDDWAEKDVKSLNATSYTFDEETMLLQGQEYTFQVYAYDSGVQLSDPVSKTVTTKQKKGTIETYPPTAPTAVSRLGTVKVSWNGRLQSGPSTTVAASSDVVALKIYVSTVSGFTPSASTLVKTVRVFGPDGGFDVLTDLAYSTSYYIRITLVNTSGYESAPSAQVTAQVQPLVNTDLIANTLTTWPFAGQVVSAGSLANGAVNASSLLGPNVVTQAAISANAIGADQIAAGSIIAGKIGVDAVTANTIRAGAIEAGKLAVNAVTADNIEAGAITAVKIRADAVEADKIKAGAVTADKLVSDLVLANVIRTATSGARIEIRGAQHPAPGIVSFKDSGTAFRFYSNGLSYLDDVSISGDVKITSGGNLIVQSGGDISVTSSGFITGGTIRTSASYPRLELSQSTSSLRARWDSTLDARLIGASWGMYVDSGFSVVGIATANTYSYNIRGNAFDGKFVRGSVYSTSDSRLKTDISNSSLGLDLINQIQTVEYKWTADTFGNKNIGVIAQDVKEVLDRDYPDFSEYFVHADGVEKLPNGEAAYGVHYNRFIPVLMNAVRELSAQVEELRSEVKSLKETK